MANSSAHVESSEKFPRAVGIAAAVGSLVDWYDFIIALTAAALVFPTVFFSASMSPVVASALSLAVIGVTYISRLAGAVIFGHIGDRAGRKATLLGTLTLGVVGSVGVGLLPSYDTIGVAAPVLLMLLRILFGIGLGGEYGGATTWVAEYANKSKYRTFWTMWPHLSSILGASLSVATFGILIGSFPHPYFISTAWRFAFLIGGGMAAVGLAIRYMLDESPIFDDFKKKGEVHSFPIKPLLKTSWKQVLGYGLAFIPNIATIAIIFIPFSELIFFGVTGKIGVPSYNAFFWLATGLGLSIFPAIFSYKISDMIGRRKTMILSNVGVVLFVYPFLYIVEHSVSPVLLTVGVFVLYSLSVLAVGSIPPILAESFDPKYRDSGVGITFQVAAVYAGIVTGIIIPSILVAVGGYAHAGVSLAAVEGAAAFMGIVIAVFLMKETKGVDLQSSALKGETAEVPASAVSGGEKK